MNNLVLYITLRSHQSIIIALDLSRAHLFSEQLPHSSRPSLLRIRVCCPCFLPRRSLCSPFHSIRTLSHCSTRFGLSLSFPLWWLRSMGDGFVPFRLGFSRYPSRTSIPLARNPRSHLCGIRRQERHFLHIGNAANSRNLTPPTTSYQTRRS